MGDIKMILTVLITTFRRANLLKWNLLSLSRQKFFTDFEIIVLNDGIEDDTENICNYYRDVYKLNIRYIFTGQRNKNKIIWRVPGFAFNIGVKQAKGEIIILSCAEMFLVNDELQLMINPLLKNKKLLVIPEGKSDTKGIFLNHINENNGVIKDNSIYETLPKLRTEIPFFMSINKQEFIDIGGYDENFTGWAFDDDDLMDRLRRNGNIYNKTKLKVIHLFHKRLRNRHLKEQGKFNNSILKKNKEQKIIVVNKNKEWGKM